MKEIGGECSTYGELRNAYTISVRKPEGKQALGIFKFRWKNHAKIYLKGTDYESVNWIPIPQGRYQWRTLFNGVVNLRVP
jgi:hypothetical protein